MNTIRRPARWWERLRASRHDVARVRSSRHLAAAIGVVAFAAGTGAAAALDLGSLSSGASQQPQTEVVAAVTAPDDVTVEIVTEHVVMEPQLLEVDDAYALKGTTRIVTRGQAGEAVVTYDVTFIDGVEHSRVITREVVVKAPVDEVVSVGTLVVPKTTAAQKGSNRELGQQMAADLYGWTGDEWLCLDNLWQKESNWNHLAGNPTSGAYGIPQALPASKMKSAGSDYMTNPATQIKWGLGYIKNRAGYGTPCRAWAHFLEKNWY